MNLNAYDNITEKIDKNRTWIDVKRKQLISRELSNKTYYSLLKRYNDKRNITSYFIAVFNTPTNNIQYKHIIRDNYGRIKINLSNIWRETCLSCLDSNCNIVLNLVESDEDGAVYYIDI